MRESNHPREFYSDYQNWLTYLNANPADFRTIVNGFASLTEYRLRFCTP